MSTQEEELEEVFTGQQPTVRGSSLASTSLLSEPPAFPIPLPSKGILYRNENDPRVSGVDKDGTIMVRPLTLEELELFLQPELIESGNLVDVIFSRCIKSPNVDPKYLIVPDRNFILYYVRAKSYGPNYTFSFSCTNCRKEIEHTINIGKLPVKTLDEIFGDKDENGKVKQASLKKIKEPFTTELSSGTVIKWKFARGIDEATGASERYDKRVKNALKNDSSISLNDRGETVIRNIDPTLEKEKSASNTKLVDDDRETLLETLLKQIVEINGFTGDAREQALKNTIAGDISEIQQLLQRYTPGLNTRIEIRCPNPRCTHKNKLEVPFTESFFRRDV